MDFDQSFPFNFGTCLTSSFFLDPRSRSHQIWRQPAVRAHSRLLRRHVPSILFLISPSCTSLASQTNLPPATHRSRQLYQISLVRHGSVSHSLELNVLSLPRQLGPTICPP